MSLDANLPVVELVLLLLTIGAAGGFLSGLLGVGGGILFVPALFFAMSAVGLELEHAMHISIATSLLIVLATGATSAIAHYHRGSVEPALLRDWGPFILLGVVVGSFFASYVEGEVLKKFFAGMTLAISLYMAFGKEKKAETRARFLTLNVQRGICTAIGIASAMLGIGGAIMTVPLMSYSGLAIQRAVGTGAALGTIISLPATLGFMAGGILHQIDGLPPGSVGYAIIPTSMLLAPVGVRISHAMPRVMLRRVFAFVLLVVSIRMFTG